MLVVTLNKPLLTDRFQCGEMQRVLDVKLKIILIFTSSCHLELPECNAAELSDDVNYIC